MPKSYLLRPPKSRRRRPPKTLSVLLVAVARCVPPESMPNYYRTWRLWWRVALGLLRAEGIRDRATRDALHDRLLQNYQAAALRQGGPDA